MVGKIATGEIAEVGYAAPGRKISGKAGAAARAAKLSPQQRSAIAKAAASTRWKERRVEMTDQTRLMRALFEHEGRTHVDIKFFRGTGQNVTSEDVCREAVNALFQIDNGLVDADVDFTEDFKQVDVTELVKQL
jgi:hypothetical protein